LWLALAILAGVWPVGSAHVARAAQTNPGCNGNITPAQTEGPYYKTGSPERTSLLESGFTGDKLVLAGYVYDKNCKPISGAWIDFWQTDGAGVYDNSGYKGRGHQFTNAAGAYRLETVIPGLYPGRTRHIHVKVRGLESGPTITSQIYFPGEGQNSGDSIFNPALLATIAADGQTGTFNFVLNVTAPAAQPPAVPADKFTFVETGFTVSGAFWTAWLGGRSYADSLYINGLPLSPMRDEVSPTDGKTYKTQWFERARFEQHPENQPPSDVLLGLLGAAAAKGRESEAPFKRVSNPGGQTWFSQTGHTLGDSSEGGKAIASFWNRLGGLQQFGYPLSQPFTETNKDTGKSYLVQYFERQRFEYHPENKGTQFEVLLGRLGAEQMKTP
jgi:protocatechuate 3,4-dioxygenase beta subunit